MMRTELNKSPKTALFHRLKEEIHDVNDLPSKSANLLPEFTSPAWMLEQVSNFYTIRKVKKNTSKQLLYNTQSEEEDISALKLCIMVSNIIHKYPIFHVLF